MSDVTLSIPKEVMQNEVLRLIAEKAIGQSIVDAVARALDSYSVKEEVNKALKHVMYDVAVAHIRNNPDIAGMVQKAVDETLTQKILTDALDHVISKLQRGGY